MRARGCAQKGQFAIRSWDDRTAQQYPQEFCPRYVNGGFVVILQLTGSPK